jgi:hypothetical protein
MYMHASNSVTTFASVPSSLTTLSGVRRYKYMHPRVVLYHARWCPVRVIIRTDHVHAVTDFV